MEKRNDHPTYKEVINTPRQSNMWRPYQADGSRTEAEVVVANAAVPLAFVLLFAMIVGTYAGALWLTNIGRDALISMMPGCANSAAIIGIALKGLATASVAWFIKICWDCVPYVLTKLRENADDVF